MRKSNPLSNLVFAVIVLIGLAFAYAAFAIDARVASATIAIGAIVVALAVSYAIRIADQWEKVVVLRLGRFRSLEGPGLFFIIPIVETAPYWIDTRVITSSFRAEKTLTRDTVPVNVDAVLFWKVVDPKMAALEVADYGGAINWAAQTALRDVIGKTMLADMLEGRDKISDELQEDHRSADRAVGRQRDFGGGQGRADPAGARRRDVDAGASRARTPGAGDPRRFRAAGRREIRRGRQDLSRQSGRPALEGDEHAL